MAAKKDAALFVRLEPHELAALDKLTERYPAVSRSHVARVAMRLGLEQIKANPLLLLEAEQTKAPTPKRKRKR